MIAEHVARARAAIARARSSWRAVRGNGCTGVPDWSPAFTACCNAHDARYRTRTDCDGLPLTRAQADALLYACLSSHARTLAGRYIVAPLYWIGVRAFGRAFWRRSAKEKAPDTPGA